MVTTISFDDSKVLIRVHLDFKISETSEVVLKDRLTDVCILYLVFLNIFYWHKNVEKDVKILRFTKLDTHYVSIKSEPSIYNIKLEPEKYLFNIIYL